jgi:hypothetical protein
MWLQSITSLTVLATAALGTRREAFPLQATGCILLPGIREPKRKFLFKENTQMKKTLGLLIVCTLALAAADDPFVGTWKLNVAKSKFTGPPLKSQTVTIGADNKVEVSGVDGTGQAVRWSYTLTSGKATITGIPEARVREMRKGNTVDHTWKMGTGTQKGHGVISKDGKTMIYTLQGTDADGKKVDDRSVYEKQ